MVTNNEAVNNFLNGKRNLAAYQFSQLIRDLSVSGQAGSHSIPDPNKDDPSAPTSNSNNLASNSQSTPVKSKLQPNIDEIAFNYAIINLFTGCPQRASIIFTDLVIRYPRNPRLWLRLAESMLASERSKMSEYEHIQQLANPHSRQHLIKTRNKPILIKINPNYCQQQIQQQFQIQRKTPSNFLDTVKGYLLKSLELINEYIDLCHPSSDPSEQAFETLGPQTGRGAVPSTSATSNLPSMNSSMLTDKNFHPLLENQASTDLSEQLSYVNPYLSISRLDLFKLKNKVLLNLAYICLCMGEPLKAIKYTSQCLKKNLAGYERVLTNLYHAEACILAGMIDDATRFLSHEVINSAKNLETERPYAEGDIRRVVYGDDMQRQLEAGTLATVVRYNLSVAYASKGEFSKAYSLLMRCIQPTKPNPMPIIICLLYLQLQLGELESAKRTILNNLPQFR